MKNTVSGMKLRICTEIHITAWTRRELNPAPYLNRTVLNTSTPTYEDYF